MKKIYVLLLLISGFAQAQIINFPDANLKARLLAASPLSNIASTTYPTPNQVSIDTNNNGEIEVGEASIIKTLSLDNSNISDLTGVEYFSGLKILSCNQNNLSNVDFTILPDDYDYLFLSDNLFTSLDVSPVLNLISLDCENNPMTSLTVNVNLGQLYAPNNSLLTNLDLGYCNQLGAILIYNCALTNLTIRGAGSNLQCYGNPISNLTLLGSFSNIQIQNAQLTVADFSQCSLLPNAIVNFTNNPLEMVNFKNGNPETNVNFSGLYEDPLNVYLCVDENEVASHQANIDNFSSTWNAASYCSFNPGGDYNTITGSALFDSNNNGCDNGDINENYIRIDISGSAGDGAAFSNNMGNYSLYTEAGTFTLTPSVENSAWFNFSPPTAAVNFPIIDNSVTVQDFCVTANGTHPDIEVVISPYIPASPGLEAVYKIVYRNKGNQILSGNVAFNFDFSRLDFVNANPPADNLTEGTATFNYSTLQPFENRSAFVTLDVNAPTDTPPVNNDDVLQFTATANPVSGDELPTDNTFIYNQIVVGSFDPNDKVCIEGNSVNPENIGGYLHYMINFENTGTAPAQNIVVKDIIDTTKFDINTLQVMNSSHSVDVRIDGNKVEFIFQNILLPSSIVSPIGGHGNVLFKIKTLPTLPIGTMVTNTANIYFDYNHPIETNEARTTFTQLSTKDYTADSSVTIYPNPTENKIHIEAKSNIKSIQVFDIQGRILEHTNHNAKTTNLDISNRQNGIYFLKITTRDGVKVEKIIKE